MPNVSARNRAGSAFLFAGAALALHVDPAVAGGFAPREQSAQFQGTSWAGSAAGGGLSSMFWNPAAATFVRHGIAVETHAALILPDSEITILPGSTTGGIGTTTDIGVEAFVPSSYMAWRMDPRTVLGVSLNSPYGLTTKPDDPNWGGAFHARTSKLFSFNVTPTVAYQVLPTLAIGAGVQFELFDLAALKSRSLANPAFTSDLEGNHVGVGFTAGVLFTPLPGTALGLGFRSSLSHDLEGSVRVGPVFSGIEADVDTPETVTASFAQDIAPNLRLLGTVEWTNWSRLDLVPVMLDGNGPFGPDGTTIAVLDFQWDDGWIFSLGGEYDWSPKLTLRAGGAYELSPIRSPTQRLVQLPDNDRIWASIGATYKWSEALALDVAYSHVFVEEGLLDRVPASAPFPRLLAEAESSVDIVSVSMKWKYGAPEAPAAPLK
jgi:long-chain fatty acid transport protein